MDKISSEEQSGMWYFGPEPWDFGELFEAFRQVSMRLLKKSSHDVIVIDSVHTLYDTVQPHHIHSAVTVNLSECSQSTFDTPSNQLSRILNT